MDAEFTFAPTADERPMLEKLLDKIFPTRPLYVFIAVAAVLLVVMAVQHFVAPSKYSLMFMGVSLLCIVLGGAILLATKRSLPAARKQLLDGIGQMSRYTFSDGQLTAIGADGACVSYPVDKVIGQYHTDRYYVFCVSNRTQMIPMVIGVTPDNIDALNKVVQENSARGIKLKKLKIK